MSLVEPFDGELVALRARRRAELQHTPTVRIRGPAPPVGPFEIGEDGLAAFLATHPRVLLDIWAPWCGPCRAMAPVLDRLAAELAPSVVFAKTNADLNPALVARWNVAGIPTMIIFEGGREIDRVVGATSGEALLRRIRAAFRLTSAPPVTAV